MEITEDRLYGTGRRKTAVARVWLKPGSGKFKVNGRILKDYCPQEVVQSLFLYPLRLFDVMDKYDVKVNVGGGGITGQAGAIRHGISRALIGLGEDVRIKLRREGLLTRDSRSKERKKYGQRGARARFQYSKR